MAAAAVAEQRPIRLVVRDTEMGRSRLTVFFRLVLAIPSFRLVTLRGIAAFIVAFVLWLAVLIEGTTPQSLHDFVAGYLRYATQVGAYVFLAADPYPWFRCQADYPVDLEIDPPVRQSRWTGIFRLVLALPAPPPRLGPRRRADERIFGPELERQRGRRRRVRGVVRVSSGGVAAVAAFLAWFAILARGTEPRGLRDLTAFALNYAAQAGGYLLSSLRSIRHRTPSAPSRTPTCRSTPCESS